MESNYKYNETEIQLIKEIELDTMRLKKKVEKVTGGGMPLSAPAFHGLWDGLIESDRALDYYKEIYKIK
tara:strand:+ start:382 stop:588 length:207 start_codon:yes stop_codon:yes gene_type:complete